MDRYYFSLFKQNLGFMGLILSLQIKADNKPFEPKTHNPNKTSSFSEFAETRDPIKIQPLQNEALKKLQEIIACSSGQKDVSNEALSSKIKEALKPVALKFLDQHVDITIKHKEIPKDISEIKNVLKSEKLSIYFNKIFLKLSEEQTIDTYLKKATGYVDKGAVASNFFEGIHTQENSSISKTLTEAAQEIKANSQKNKFVCETEMKSLEVEILKQQKELEKAEKAVKEAATDKSKRESTGKTYDIAKAKLEDLKKEAELNEAKILLQSVNQSSEIKEELLKKFPIKEDISPEQVVDMKFKSEDIKNKEIKLKKAQKEYELVNNFFTNATKPNSEIDLKNSNILENKKNAELALKQAKTEFDEAKSARNEIENLKKYSSAIKSIEDSFHDLVFKSESKSAQETLKYIKKKAPSLLDREGKIKYATSDEIKEVKKVLLEKLSEKSLREKWTEGAKDLLLKFRYDPTK